MLTKKQHEVLTVIDEHIQEHGYAPTYEEIAKAIGVVAKGPITKHIKALEREGYIRHVANTARAIEITKAPRLKDTPANDDEGFPLVGRIAAGQPMLAFENTETVDLNQRLGHGRKRFLLEVHGESMIEAGIFDGDWVLIEPKNVANQNDIVVALVDDYEATLKRYRRKGNVVTLIPENKSMPPMEFPADRVQIQGIVVAQIRQYA